MDAAGDCGDGMGDGAMTGGDEGAGGGAGGGASPGDDCGRGAVGRGETLEAEALSCGASAPPDASDVVPVQALAARGVPVGTTEGEEEASVAVATADGAESVAFGARVADPPVSPARGFASPLASDEDSVHDEGDCDSESMPEGVFAGPPLPAAPVAPSPLPELRLLLVLRLLLEPLGLKEEARSSGMPSLPARASSCMPWLLSAAPVDAPPVADSATMVGGGAAAPAAATFSSLTRRGFDAAGGRREGDAIVLPLACTRARTGVPAETAGVSGSRCGPPLVRLRGMASKPARRMLARSEADDGWGRGDGGPCGDKTVAGAQCGDSWEGRGAKKLARGGAECMPSRRSLIPEPVGRVCASRARASPSSSRGRTVMVPVASARRPVGSCSLSGAPSSTT